CLLTKNSPPWTF
nr:immunoglobulin light chain junction region [Macaca mulatta]MOV93156.1 immunoglobulin light chain junction region [Macaca mulatta]MOV93883.1 immunoglobulin light chain junction region [Macaca mulatta]MOV94137.1 immunoglobulin light chain junction region [Macaca mulatta]